MIEKKIKYLENRQREAWGGVIRQHERRQQALLCSLHGDSDLRGLQLLTELTEVIYHHLAIGMMTHSPLRL